MRTQEEELFYLEQISKNKSLNELNKTRDRVAWLLYNKEELRNSDELLIKEYRRFFGEDSATESITRVRRLLQNKLGWCKPSEEVQQHRSIREKAFKEWVINQ
jgi:hypothetical protein